jgi:uncharacterized membrane protein
MGFSSKVGLVLLVLTALVLRLPGMRTDFWFDEILTWEVVDQQIHRSLDAFTVKLDNNHPLNTLLMYWMGDLKNWSIYRIPALIAGLGSVLLAARIGWRRSAVHGLVCAAAFACSYPLVVYSTEARGYSLAVFFTLLAVEGVEGFLIDGRRWYCVLYAIAVILGFLSHAGFLISYAATFCYSAVLVWPMNRSAAKELLMCHAIPVAFVAPYLVWYVNRVAVGGGSLPIGELILDTPALALGIGSGESTGLATGALAILATLSVLCFAGVKVPRLLALLIPGVLLVPALLSLTAAARRTPLFPRYFLAGIVLLVLALGLTVAELAVRRPKIGLALLAVFLGLNLTQDYWFSRIGRGQPLAALREIASSSGSVRITLGSTQHFRTVSILNFYARYLPDDLEIHYMTEDEWATKPLDWYIIDTLHRDFPRNIELAGQKFRLHKVYPKYGVSGLDWAVYESAMR